MMLNGGVEGPVYKCLLVFISSGFEGILKLRSNMVVNGHLQEPLAGIHVIKERTWKEVDWNN